MVRHFKGNAISKANSFILIVINNIKQIPINKKYICRMCQRRGFPSSSVGTRWTRGPYSRRTAGGAWGLRRGRRWPERIGLSFRIHILHTIWCFSAIFMETSSKDGSNILDSLVLLAREMCSSEDVEVQTSTLMIREEKNKKNCCSSGRRGSVR